MTKDMNATIVLSSKMGGEHAVRFGDGSEVKAYVVGRRPHWLPLGAAAALWPPSAEHDPESEVWQIDLPYFDTGEPPKVLRTNCVVRE
jgi:hypothetical protein